MISYILVNTDLYGGPKPSMSEVFPESMPISVDMSLISVTTLYLKTKFSSNSNADCSACVLCVQSAWRNSKYNVNNQKAHKAVWCKVSFSLSNMHFVPLCQHVVITLSCNKQASRERRYQHPEQGLIHIWHRLWKTALSRVGWGWGLCVCMRACVCVLEVGVGSSSLMFYYCTVNREISPVFLNMLI